MQTNQAHQSISPDHVFILPSNWTYQRHLELIGANRQAASLASLAGCQVERSVRAALADALAISPRRVIRYGQDGQVRFRECDSIYFDHEGVVLYEIKLTDDRKYIRKGLNQLRSVAEILRSTGYRDRIRCRLIVVSNRAQVAAGLAPETSLANTDLFEATVRISTTVLACYAERAGVALPRCWDDSRTRFASSVPRWPAKRRTALAGGM